MYKLVLIVGLVLFTGCSKKSNSKDNLDVYVDFKLISKSGVDLLDPNTHDSYNTSNIQLIYLIDGVEKLYYCGNCDNQKGYSFYKRNDTYVIRIAPNFSIQQDNSDPITYIQWNESDRDTLRCYINRTNHNSSIICTKVWYNGTVLYDGNGERFFTVIKN